MFRSIIGLTLVLVSFSILTSCRGTSGTPRSLGPNPVTGIDDNPFFWNINFNQERNLQIAPTNPNYSDVSVFHASIDVDFCTEDADGRISAIQTITPLIVNHSRWRFIPG